MAKQNNCPTTACGVPTPAPRTVNVYIDDGRVFFYTVSNSAKAREHAASIAERGYRHNDGEEYEVYPPHRISKIKITGGSVDTTYLDQVRGA